jgi:hypothetical protein
VKKLKTIFFITISSIFIKVDDIFAAFWLEKIHDNLEWSNNALDIVIQNWVVIILGFLAIIMVLYWIYWWFLIFTSKDDEGVKKWRSVIFQSLIGLVVIFLAWPIINLFIWTDWIFTK